MLANSWLPFRKGGGYTGIFVRGELVHVTTTRKMRVGTNGIESATLRLRDNAPTTELRRQLTLSAD
jgi:hypothetical protein